MKKSFFSIFVFTLAVVVLSGCVGFGKISYDKGQEKLAQISQKLESGEITAQEAEQMKQSILGKMETLNDSLKRTSEKISDFAGVPEWAQEIGVTEPQGLTFVPEESNMTEDDRASFPDSFTAVYRGDVDIMMREARVIKEKFDLDVMFDKENLYIANGDVNGRSIIVVVADNGKGMMLTYTVSKVAQ